MDDIRLLSTCSAKTERFCDFESSDICNYTTNLTQSDVKWQRGSRMSLASGPLVDQYAFNFLSDFNFLINSEFDENFST